jgi:hypothetical protein
MDELPSSYDHAVHSDFLIHWTGKDIDTDFDPVWYDDHRSNSKSVTTHYLKRLQDILTHGLWLTEEPEQNFQIGNARITIPPVPQCCFTELKLSQSRVHARRNGRLGIGLKRPFVFERFGRPLAYFGFGIGSSKDRFLKACSEQLTDKSLLNFFKPMNRDSHTLNYDLYGESEWRVIYFEDLIRSKRLIDPRDPKNVSAHNYFQSLTPSQQTKLKYLLPLDGWFAMIIYPTLDSKMLLNGTKAVRSMH